MRKQIPERQIAVQLVGPDKLELNTDKEVFQPGPHQVLARVEAVGLCFSDLKLLKQFTGHARKSEVVSGIEPEVLKKVPSYVPNEAPTVPGHEAVVRVAAVGEGVTAIQPDGRYLVQTDYRWLRTANSNAAFGYNFEGGLQEYVLMDERVITSPEGESFLIPASDELSAAAVALCEPWACVEQAYAFTERRTLKPDGLMLVVYEDGQAQPEMGEFIKERGKPRQIDSVKAGDLDGVSSIAYDDIVYAGSNPDVVEQLFSRLALGGLFIICLCGGELGRDVTVPVGRVHYGGIRIIGTVGSDPAEAIRAIPETGELRQGDVVHVIGAGGPMGMMHVIRDICQGLGGITLYAADLDEQRLEMLNDIAAEPARKNKVTYKGINPSKDNPDEEISYVVLMVPAAKLVAASVKTAAEKAIINIFAGIPATVDCELDLQRYIARQMYFIGTSGSTLADMMTVLDKVQSGRLDTNLSVAAVSGLDGAIAGIRAVENQEIPGKIIVYPACKGLEMTPLDKIARDVPAAGEALAGGVWNKAAETALLDNHQ